MLDRFAVRKKTTSHLIEILSPNSCLSFLFTIFFIVTSSDSDSSELYREVLDIK